jgi:hypothetical protein
MVIQVKFISIFHRLMGHVQFAIVMVIPRYVTEPRGIAHHIARITPLATTASFVNPSSLVTPPFKVVLVSVVYS